jgi:hypothetical protein
MQPCEDSFTYEQLRAQYPHKDELILKEGEFFSIAFNDQFAKYCIDEDGIRQETYGIEQTCILFSAVLNMGSLNKADLYKYIASSGKCSLIDRNEATSQDDDATSEDHDATSEDDDASSDATSESSSDEESVEEDDDDDSDEEPMENDGGSDEEEEEPMEDDDGSDEEEEEQMEDDNESNGQMNDNQIELGKNLTTISDDLYLDWNNPQTAIYDIIDDIYGDDISDYNIKGRNGKNKVDKDIISDIVEYVQKHTQLNAREIREMIRKKFDLVRKYKAI